MQQKPSILTMNFLALETAIYRKGHIIKQSDQYFILTV